MWTSDDKGDHMLTLAAVVTCTPEQHATLLALARWAASAGFGEDTHEKFTDALEAVENVELVPVEFDAGPYDVHIDLDRKHGYYEHRDFGDEDSGAFTIKRALTDYDEVGALPQDVVDAIRTHGYVVEWGMTEEEPD